MPDRTCQDCGAAFYQHLGRPAKRCVECRGKYGDPEFRRASSPKAREAAYGTACYRCQKPMVPGQRLDLDHRDDGDGWSWSHSRCNRSAAATRGNRARAAAYRAAKGLPDPPPQRDAGTPDDPPIIGSLHLIPGWNG